MKKKRIKKKKDLKEQNKIQSPSSAKLQAYMLKYIYLKLLSQTTFCSFVCQFVCFVFFCFILFFLNSKVRVQGNSWDSTIWHMEREKKQQQL